MHDFFFFFFFCEGGTENLWGGGGGTCPLGPPPHSYAPGGDLDQMLGPVIQYL